jgi:zinc transport system permease protein
VKTWEYLTSPELALLIWPGVIAGLAIAAMCSLLSVLVVLKRMAFIGQGISHAAFGGVGVAAVLGFTATTTTQSPAGGLWQFLIVSGFCLAAALGVGLLPGRSAAREDTAIGIVLVSSMAVGAILLSIARIGLSWESFLFGSILNVSRTDAGVAWALALGVAGVVWWVRRPLVFWAFDERSAPAFGVRAGRMKLLLLTLLALATVTAMKLAGVVLATAMLVLPGAIALQLSVRLGRVLGLSFAAGLLAVLLGLMVSFELDWPPGPVIVAWLTLMFAAARALGPAVRRA